MRFQSNRLLTALVIAVLGLLAACNDSPPSTRRKGSLEPDFVLRDVNPNSPTANRDVSLQLERGSISAWYFGHAT